MYATVIIKINTILIEGKETKENNKMICLEKCSNFDMHRNHQEDILKHRLLGPMPSF